MSQLDMQKGARNGDDLTFDMRALSHAAPDRSSLEWTLAIPHARVDPTSLSISIHATTVLTRARVDQLRLWVSARQNLPTMDKVHLTILTAMNKLHVTNETPTIRKGLR